MRKQERDLIEHIVLLVGLAVFFCLLFIFRYDRLTLKIVALLGSMFYVGWGIIHHLIDGRLNRKVLLEYIFMGSFVFLLFYLVLGA
jgi:hypothetical protein